jgi:hypothetical protein
MLIYFYYLDKNPGWITDYDGYAEFLRISSFAINQSTVRVVMETPFEV